MRLPCGNSDSPAIGFAASSSGRQHFLYLVPEPQGHGAFLVGAAMPSMIRTGPDSHPGAWPRAALLELAPPSSSKNPAVSSARTRVRSTSETRGALGSIRRTETTPLMLDDLQTLGQLAQRAGADRLRDEVTHLAGARLAGMQVVDLPATVREAERVGAIREIVRRPVTTSARSRRGPRPPSRGTGTSTPRRTCASPRT